MKRIVMAIVVRRLDLVYVVSLHMSVLHDENCTLRWDEWGRMDKGERTDKVYWREYMAEGEVRRKGG